MIDELQQARDRLGWLARRIREEPWSENFENELEFNTIPNIAEELENLRRAQESWLKSPQGRRTLTAIGLTAGAAATTLTLVLNGTPLLPVEIATGALTLVSSVGIAGLEFVLDWRQSNSEMPENGLHYLLQIGK